MPIQRSPVALVTGASSGMGKDFALRLLAEGYAVYGAARRMERMADLAAAGCGVIALDVTDDASIVAAVDQIIRERGRIDVLINNAGYGQFGALEDVPINEGRRQLETNLIGPARLIQLCLPHMRAQRYGRIFNISSNRREACDPTGRLVPRLEIRAGGLFRLAAQRGRPVRHRCDRDRAWRDRERVERHRLQ
jgi:NAD(P)-dependent dehydrogenase (short-subunit alcohol dehydrogenase family)